MFYAISSQDAGEAPARCSDPSTPTRSFLRDIIQPVHIAQIGTNRRSAKILERFTSISESKKVLLEKKSRYFPSCQNEAL